MPGEQKMGPLATELRDVLRETAVHTTSQMGTIVTKVAAMEDHIRWAAQTQHQAHHQAWPGTWESCPKATCKAAVDVLA